MWKLYVGLPTIMFELKKSFVIGLNTKVLKCRFLKNYSWFCLVHPVVTALHCCMSVTARGHKNSLDSSFWVNAFSRSVFTAVHFWIACTRIFQKQRSKISGHPRYETSRSVKLIYSWKKMRQKYWKMDGWILFWITNKISFHNCNFNEEAKIIMKLYYNMYWYVILYNGMKYLSQNLNKNKPMKSDSCWWWDYYFIIYKKKAIRFLRSAFK